MRSQHTYRQSRRNEWRQDRELAWTFFRRPTPEPKVRLIFNPSRKYDLRGKR